MICYRSISITWFCTVMVIALTILHGCAGIGHRLEPPEVSLAHIAIQEVKALETTFQLHVRITPCKRVEIVPVRGRRFAVEQAGFGQQATGRADAADAGTGRSNLSQPWQPGSGCIDGWKGVTPDRGQQKQIGSG